MNVKDLRSPSPASRQSKSHAKAKEPNPLRALTWATYLFIAFLVGRVLNIVPALSHLPLVKVLFVYITFALIVHWKSLPRVITPDNPAPKWLIALVVWIILSITYSIWISASRDFIVFQLPNLCLLVLIICKLSLDWESLRKLFFSMFVSATILVVASLRTYGGGRLNVEVLGDTNELAHMFDGVIPIALAFGLTTASKARRLLFYSVAAIMALAVLLTGSRGGELGLLAVGVFLVLAPATPRPHEGMNSSKKRAPRRRMGTIGRLFIWMTAVTVIGMALWPQLPPVPRARIESFLHLGSSYNVTARYGRVQIWKRGMKAFAERPIGYGIATYPMVDWKFGGLFYTAHNSLVLCLVELGPIGLLLYLGVLWHLWRGLAKIRRDVNQSDAPSEQQRQQAIFSRMSQATLLGNFVAGLFLSATYYYGHWTNIGLATALIAVFNREKTALSLERGKTLKTKPSGAL